MIYLAVFIAAFSILLTVYLTWIRPWQLRWGATDEEVSRQMPGDEIITHPHFDATRAVTINAPVEKIWPWIMQIGYTRAGWYSYDWIDNQGRPSARQIIPELQNLAVGDTIPLSKWTYETVLEIETYRFMVWQGGDGSAATDGTWVWGLYPHTDSASGQLRTRLVVRMRGRYHWRSPWILLLLVVDALDIVMLRKCLLGIKRRAEFMSVETQPAYRGHQDAGVGA